MCDVRRLCGVVLQIHSLLQTLPALGRGRRVVTVILLNECKMEVMVEVRSGLIYVHAPSVCVACHQPSCTQGQPWSSHAA